MDVFDLVAKITLDSSEYEEELKKQADDADKGGGVVGKLKKGLGTVGKAGAVAFGAVSAAATAAAGVIVKSAIDGYAEYEQLEGGVKKLFGEQSAKTVMKYAENAYKTAGMSANEYMETATSFSAALIQSLGDDTEKAANVADIAMRSMSDNVSTFGGDIESVKTAYQGFAKQNYTMLDNLKLGYGGTKTEMERLIKDANKYRKAQGKNADLTIDSFADIVEAIQTVQEEQGIAGTTQAEAMRTIQGSADATKAAWKNVTTAIAGGGDLKKAMKGLTESIFGTGGNTGLLNQIIPRVKTAFEGLADFIGQAAPLFAAKLPELVKAILPSAISAVTSIVKALASAIPGLLKAIWDSIKAVAPQLIETIKGIAAGIPGALGGIISSVIGWVSENGGTILEKGKELFDNLITGAGNALATIGTALGDIITSVGGWVMEHGSELLTEGQNLFNWIVSGIKTGIGKIGEWIGGIIDKIIEWVSGDGGTQAEGQGTAIWDALKSGIVNGITKIGEVLVDIATGIGSWVTEHGDELMAAGKNILQWIVSGIITVIGDIANGFVSLVSTITGWVTAHSGDLLAVGQNILGWIASGIKKFIENIWNGFGSLVSTIGTWVTNNSGDILSIGTDILDWITSGISDFIGRIKLGFTDLTSKIGEKVEDVGGTLKKIGGTIIDKIKGGVSGFMSRIKNGFNGMTGHIEDKVTSSVVTNKLKALGGKIVDGIAAGISGVKKIADKIGTIINNAITNATSKTYNADVKIAAKTGYKKGSEGDLPQAKALHQPYLFNKSTIFGKYQGENLIAGEAGPEMLLGVNKLNAMLFESVQGGMQSMMGQIYDMMSGMHGGGGNSVLEAQILDVLQRYLPDIAERQVVLDTGAIAGAVAPGVNAALGTQVGNRRRYNA